MSLLVTTPLRRWLRAFRGMEKAHNALRRCSLHIEYEMLYFEPHDLPLAPTWGINAPLASHIASPWYHNVCPGPLKPVKGDYMSSPFSSPKRYCFVPCLLPCSSLDCTKASWCNRNELRIPLFSFQKYSIEKLCPLCSFSKKMSKRTSREEQWTLRTRQSLCVSRGYIMDALFHHWALPFFLAHRNFDRWFSYVLCVVL